MYAPPRLLAHSDVRDPEVLVLDCSGPASMTEAELFCKKKIGRLATSHVSIYK